MLSGNLCARAWGFSLLSARGSRARVFFVTKLRLAVTAASDRLRLACVKKSGSLPRFVPNRVFRIFSLATLACAPCALRPDCIEKSPDARSRKASDKGKTNISQTSKTLFNYGSSKPYQRQQRSKRDHNRPLAHSAEWLQPPKEFFSTSRLLPNLPILSVSTG